MKQTIRSSLTEKIYKYRYKYKRKCVCTKGKQKNAYTCYLNGKGESKEEKESNRKERNPSHFKAFQLFAKCK